MAWGILMIKKLSNNKPFQDQPFPIRVCGQTEKRAKHAVTGHGVPYRLVAFSCSSVICAPSVQYYYLVLFNIRHKMLMYGKHICQHDCIILISFFCLPVMYKLTCIIETVVIRDCYFQVTMLA